jgi:sugar phosphate isomerase/epimerase
MFRWAATIALGLLLSLGTGHAAELANPFFAMDTGTANGFAEAKIAMLKEVGYTGVDFSALASFGRSVEQLPEVLAAVDRHGLVLYAVYFTVEVDGRECPAEVRRAIELRGRSDAVIWAALSSARFAPGSAEGDAAAVATVRSMAELAGRAGLRVALYPHTGQYAERVADNVRIAQEVSLPNLGVTWNLCHWLKVESGQGFLTTATLALPYLMRVTVNGADAPKGDPGWDRLIQPLGAGKYDVYEFVSRLRDLGYRGPIGLQGYGIKDGDPSIACSADTQGDQAKGQTAMENCLQRAPDIDVVYTINEPAAAGAYRAIRAAGREKNVLIVSVDGGCAGVRNVRAGMLGATAQQYPLKMASLGVEAAVEYAKTGKKVSGTIDTGVTLITDKPMKGVDSRDTAFGLDGCWGNK